jgi:hypothetical protein
VCTAVIVLECAVCTAIIVLESAVCTTVIVLESVVCTAVVVPESAECTAVIILESAVCTAVAIRDSMEKIKSCTSATYLSTACLLMTGLAIMEKIQHVLTTYIKYENQEHVLLSTQVI